MKSLDANTQANSLRLWITLVALLLVVAGAILAFVVVMNLPSNRSPAAPVLAPPAATTAPASIITPTLTTRPVTATRPLTLPVVPAPTVATLRAPAPAISPTLPASAPRATPSPTGCVPQIASFTADRLTINRGESTTLRWGIVASAVRAEVDNGIGVVAAPGERVVAPAQTTTYTLAAMCGSNRATKVVTVTVAQPAATPIKMPLTATPPTANPTPPAGQRRDLVGIWVAGKYTLQFFELGACNGVDCLVQGEYAEWASGSLPVPGLIGGTFNSSTGAVALTITGLPGATKTFAGAIDATGAKMTGTLSGVGALTFTKQ